MRRILVGAVVMLAMIASIGAHADTASYGAPYVMGGRGGDEANIIHADPAAGEITVVRLGGHALSGSLGCLAQGGYANFLVRHTVVSGVDTVTIDASDVVLDNFTWIVGSVKIAGEEGSLNAVKARGPVVGDYAMTIPAVSPLGQKAEAGDVLEIRIGLETASSCPSVDGGHAVFDSVSVA